MTETPAKYGKNQPTLRELLEGELFREQVAKALPRHLTPDRFIRVAVTTMNRTPKLAQCDQASFFNALLTLSQVGLEADGRRAYLIPFENKKKGIIECQLIIGYQGLVELISNADGTRVHADIVCENDEFQYDRGQIQVHHIDFRKPRGAPYAAYTIFRFTDGYEKAEVMSKEEIYAVRDKSSAWKAFKQYGTACPWSDPQSEPEMWKKTTLRRGSKWVKLSPEQRDIIERDDTQFTEAFAARPPIAMPQAIAAPEPQAHEEEPAQGASASREPAEACDGNMATGPQIRTIHTILTKLGIADDLARHEKVSNVLALEQVVISLKDLTKQQASEAIADLGKELPS